MTHSDNIPSPAPRRRPSGALVAACLALLLSLGGTAAAAALISGAQIRDGSLTGADVGLGAKGVRSVDLRDGSLELADIAAPTRSQFRELEPNGLLRPGQTVTGTFGQSMYHVPNVGSDYRLSVMLPLPTSPVLGNASVNFAADANAATTDDDASCTGTLAAPTAPSGKVCLYPSFSFGVSSASGLALAQLGDRGFAVTWTSNSPASATLLYGSWAYTPPFN